MLRVLALIGAATASGVLITLAVSVTAPAATALPHHPEEERPNYDQP
jgi:hypothetical protein